MVLVVLVVHVRQDKNKNKNKKESTTATKQVQNRVCDNGTSACENDRMHTNKRKCSHKPSGF